MRKMIFDILVMYLTVQVCANDTASKIRRKGANDINVSKRRLDILPTLLKKLLIVKKKFNDFDGIIGDVLFGLAPSDSPSMSPSDSPSHVPSVAPSSAPSLSPSAAPFSWNDFIGNNSNDFETCPTNPHPVNFTSSTDLTILYGYKMELKPNTVVLKVTEAIEDLLQANLIQQVCITSTHAVGVTSSPLDIPVGICGSNEETNGVGPCVVIAGRLKLLIGLDSIEDISSVYCEFLEAIRTYISSDDIVSKLEEVVSINSTISGSLVPDFCEIEPTEVLVNDIEGSATVESRSANGTSNHTVPITIGLFVGLCAITMLFLYTRYRNFSTESQKINNNISSGSDLEFQHSDETESNVACNRTSNNPVISASDVKLERTESDAKLDTAEIQNIPADCELPKKINTNKATFSLANTEQEIIFSPSSSVASSFLFHSP